MLVSINKLYITWEPIKDHITQHSRTTTVDRSPQSSFLLDCDASEHAPKTSAFFTNVYLQDSKNLYNTNNVNWNQVNRNITFNSNCHAVYFRSIQQGLNL